MKTWRNQLACPEDRPDVLGIARTQTDSSDHGPVVKRGASSDRNIEVEPVGWRPSRGPDRQRGRGMPSTTVLNRTGGTASWLTVLRPVEDNRRQDRGGM